MGRGERREREGEGGRDFAPAECEKVYICVWMEGVTVHN